MSLTAGTKLGSYEIISLIGAGGMGEVYKAHDTKLGREVAIKVLPEAFSQDKERLARFEREARLLASLNHPNIATIYDFEEFDGTHFLVLEFVPGETLAERIKRGPIPVDEALPLFKQIAEGLEAAHEKGIIHRDLKPANVKVTPEGKPKVLDFGLAKAMASEVPDQGLSESPTMTRGATEAGILLGTAPYMSPEQARGKAVDRRADIWAFGCCLYEGLTGKVAFLGETVSDTIAGIIAREPDWDAMPSATPLEIQKLIRRCLRKDPMRRLREVGDARIAIEDCMSEPMSAESAVPVLPVKRRFPTLVVTAAVAAILAGLAAWNLKPTATPRPVARFALHFPPDLQLLNLDRPAVAVSPDGRHFVYVAHRGDIRQIYMRAADQLEGQPLAGTEDGHTPFFSPDGRWIGFIAKGKLKKVSINGGPPIAIADASTRGASWGPGDMIVFTQSIRSGIWEVSANGGTPQELTSLNEEMDSHRWPQLLPGGKAVLFTVSNSSTNTWDDAQIKVQSLETGERRLLVEGGTFGRYVPTGHLVYARSGTLLAAPFDVIRLEVTGPAVPFLEGVAQDPSTGSVQYGFSNVGELVYLSGGPRSNTLVWVDREGIVQPLAAPPRTYVSPRLSPDGRQLAVVIEGPDNEVWVYDVFRNTLTRLTFERNNNFPVWTPDGNRVAFTSNPVGPRVIGNVFWVPADGSDTPELLVHSEHHISPESWSPDGKLLGFTEIHPNTKRDLWILSLEEERQSRPFLHTPFDESTPTFSPDGRWLAYESNESGRYEIYLQPYPGPGGKVQLSIDGGLEPCWAPDGQELFYRNGDKMMVVPIVTGPGLVAGKPQVLFEGHYEIFSLRNYDISPDGKRFLMIKRSEESRQLIVVQEWFEELKNLVPTN